MKDLFLDPLRLLFGRGWRMGLLAALTLILCGCNSACEALLGVETLAEIKIRVLEAETARRIECMRQLEQTSLQLTFGLCQNQNRQSTHIMQAQGAQGGGGGRLARAAVPVGTLFALNVDGSLAQLNNTTGVAVQSQPSNFDWATGAASLDNDQMYAVANSTLTGPFSPSLSFVNLSTLQIQQTIPLPATIVPRSLALSPDGRQLYLAGPANGPADLVFVLIIDVTTRTQIKTIELPGSVNRPEIIAGADGGLVFVTTARGVAVIDTLTQSLSHTIPATAEHIALDPGGTTLYAARVFNSVNAGVGVYDVATATQVDFIPVPDLRAGMSMAISPGGSFLYIDHITSDAQGRNDYPTFRAISLATRQIVITQPWTGPRDVPITPYRIIVLDQP